MNKSFYIAGVQFHDLPKGQNAIALQEAVKLANDSGRPYLLTMTPEPTNKYDPNAIALKANNLMIGYVPKGHAAEVAALLEAGVELICVVEEINPSAKKWEMIKVTITEPTLKEDEEIKGDTVEPDEYDF